MKYSALFLALIAFQSVNALEFSGNSFAPIEVNPESNTGLEAIYVLDSTAGIRASYTSTSGGSITWKRFSNLGGGFAEDVAYTTNGNTTSIALAAGDMGYIIEDNGRQHCFWIVDYSQHHLSLGSLTPADERDCGRQVLDFTGNADEIVYYTINGRRVTLSRDLELTYSTLVFDDTNFVYNTVETSLSYPSISSKVSVSPASLCSTTFSLNGDRFLRAWNQEQSIESPIVDPIAVEANTRATQTARENNDNEISDGETEYGGSAPCEITFEAAVSDAAIFHEWQISRSPDFEIYELTYSELEFTYTFQEQGTSYVRLYVANADADCDYIGPTYEVFIGESRLDIPNAFSPENQDGVNDEWKVSYKSLVSYECHIFNRWGQQLFSSTNPSEGWDGKRGGKFVGPGVYYYVIKAKGADGIEYNKAGDINIIGYSEGSTSTSGSTDGAAE